MARIPKLDAAGKFLAADVNAQIDARTKATMRADLPALAKELKIGGVDGSVPIFPTLAEAEAWMDANPGKRALTLEPSTPDTTAPSAGILSVTPTHNSALVVVSGASDDRGAVEYAFQVGAMGSWSAWQSSPEYTAVGLTVSTSYAFRHKVRDRAGNEVLGASVTATTDAAPPLQPGDVMTSDAYTLYASGSGMSGKYTDATLGGVAAQYKINADFGGAGGLQTVDGALKWTNGRSIFEFTGLPTRDDKEVTVTIKALATTTDAFYIMLRKTGNSATYVRAYPDGSVGSILQGPAGNVIGPGKPAGTVRPGSTLTFGVKGDTGYYIIDGTRTDIPSLQGNTDGYLVFDSGLGTVIDNLVVKAL